MAEVGLFGRGRPRGFLCLGKPPPCRKERDEDGAPCVRIENMEANQTRPSFADALSGQATWCARLAQVLRSQKAANSG